jgi:hypothetical protein
MSEGRLLTQLELVPLSAEEKARASLLVAALTLELEEVQTTHAEEKAEMRKIEQELAARILRLSHAIRDGQRPGIEDR